VSVSLSKPSGRVCILTSVHTPFDTRIYERQAKTFVKAGYELTLVATNIHSHQTHNRISIVGIQKPKWRIGRALNWLPFIKAALKTEADIYHFHDPDLLFVGAILKYFTKKPVIYDNHDPYIEAILQREWIPGWLRPAVSRIFGQIEKFLSQTLSAVIVANDSQQARFPQATLIRNYPDLEPFAQISNESNRAESSYIIHAGTLTEARGVFELVEIARLLAPRQIPLVALGPFANRSLETEIKQSVRQLNLQNLIRFEGRVPFEQIVRGSMGASVGLITFRAVPNHYLIVPTKLFEYMACALPVVASDLPPIRHYVAETDCGLLVPPDQPQAFAEAVEYLLDHPAEARRLGQNGRRAVLARYNWQQEEQKLLSLYQELLQ